MTGQTHNWFYRWTKVGMPGEKSYMAMFTSPSQRSNILFTLEDVNSMLEDGRPTTVPKAVMIDALHGLLKQQISGNNAAA